MEPWGGCLYVGCLEARLGRRLKPKDFLRDDRSTSSPAARAYSAGGDDD